MQIKQKSKRNKYLLDTSAIIALLNKESGYEIVDSIIANSAISSVNLSELVSVLTRAGVPENEVDSIVTDIVPEIIPFCENLAIKSGKLSKATKEFGLSLGDRACISTGDYHNMEIYTSDKIWSKLQPQISTKITIIR